MTFRFANVEGRAALVDGEGRWFDASKVSGGVVSADPMGAWLQLDELHLAAGAIADAVPNAPLIFTKFPSCLTGPTDPVVLGGSADDYEAELVVVIGRGGRGIRREEAWGHVGGLTVGQDISDRALQFAAEPAHFDLGKSRDSYGPIGPVVVSTDSFADPGDLLITCDCQPPFPRRRRPDHHHHRRHRHPDQPLRPLEGEHHATPDSYGVVGAAMVAQWAFVGSVHP